MLRSMGNTLSGEHAMKGIDAYAKNARTLALRSKNGKTPVSVAPRPEPFDRTARILRMLMLSAGSAHHPLHHDERGILFDTYG